MIMKHILLSALCFLLSLSVQAQGLSEQKMIEKMAAAAEKIQTVRCHFTQTKHMKMLKSEQVSKGKMFCQQPDQLRWEYTSPRASTLILNGTESSLDGAKNKFMGEMARMIMNSVAGKCLTDSKAFQTSAKELPTEYVATLIPLRKDMKRMYAKLVLHFDIGQETVTEVELHEKNGDRTIIELYDIQINK